MLIKVNLYPFEAVYALTYLGHTIELNKTDWDSLYVNSRKAHRRWGMVSGVLLKVGVTMWSRSMLYKNLV